MDTHQGKQTKTHKKDSETTGTQANKVNHIGTETEKKHRKENAETHAQKYTQAHTNNTHTQINTHTQHSTNTHTHTQTNTTHTNTNTHTITQPCKEKQTGTNTIKQTDTKGGSKTHRKKTHKHTPIDTLAQIHCHTKSYVGGGIK